ncbi:MAG: hypothetical protein HY537_15115 [Deltaproteobacteria bacterium]|nr:hypothetical protein [Deltaproteobacteria bacterium]
MRIWLFFLVMLCGSVQAEKSFFSYGHVYSSGFAFVGDSTSFRNQCIGWMQSQHIQFLNRLRVNSNDVNFPASVTFAQACQEILKRASDLGESQKQLRVFGLIHEQPFSFAGTTTNVLKGCVEKLSTISIKSVSRLFILEKWVDFSGSLFGPEICGEIIVHGTVIERPYDQYRVAGSINSHGFAIAGHPELFLIVCKATLAGYGVRMADRFLVDDEEVLFPRYLRGEQICDSLLERAKLITNPMKIYSAEGEAGSRPFWFAGNSLQFLYACSNWTQKEKIPPLNRIRVGEKWLEFKHFLQSSGACGIVLDNAKQLENSIEITQASGAIFSHGFAWGGSVETIASQCHSFLTRNNLGYATIFRSRGHTFHTESGYKKQDLCAAIETVSKKITPPFSRYEARGEVAGRPFWFNGLLPVFFQQCSDFMEKYRFGLILSVSLFGKTKVLSSGLYGSEACDVILSGSQEASDQSLILSSGHIEENGFSFAGLESNFFSSCTRFLNEVKITKTDKMVVLDKLYTKASGWPNVNEICKEVLEHSSRHKEFAVLDIAGTVESVGYHFRGTADQTLLQCSEFLTKNKISTASHIQVDGSSYMAPFNRWYSEEICGVILVKKLGLDGP